MIHSLYTYTRYSLRYESENFKYCIVFWGWNIYLNAKLNILFTIPYTWFEKTSTAPSPPGMQYLHSEVEDPLSMKRITTNIPTCHGIYLSNIGNEILNVTMLSHYVVQENYYKLFIDFLGNSFIRENRFYIIPMKRTMYGLMVLAYAEYLMQLEELI